MKIGILTDIHEDVDALSVAIGRLQQERVDRVVVLGDLFETGQRIEPTVALLAAAGVIGVWGNHELGLCHEPDDDIRTRYAGTVIDYMLTLRSRLELAGCLFSHGLPSWDATDPAAYYLEASPETNEGRTAAFAATTARITFVGHYHRWLLVTPEHDREWDNREAIRLDPDDRYLVVVAAVCDGWCATFDTDTFVLTPMRLLGGPAAD